MAAWITPTPDGRLAAAPAPRPTRRDARGAGTAVVLALACALPLRAAPAEPACAPTLEVIEGPYHREGAPFRADVAAGAEGEPLVLSGRVLGPDCRTPVAGAVLDVWQADGRGHYHRESLRGRVRAAADGTFSLRTVVPGAYREGRFTRTPHIHVKVTAPGHRPLTTQLFFPRDPLNERDLFFRPELTLALGGGGDGPRTARFDFVLAVVR